MPRPKSFAYCVISLLMEHNPGKLSFTFKEICEATEYHSHTLWMMIPGELLPTHSNYIADLLKNAATKPKNPTIGRYKWDDGLWHYYIVGKFSPPK